MTSHNITMKDRPAILSPLALSILALLDESAMYPYRMQQLMRERGKDEVVNVRHRASLYQTITRLERDGLIEIQGSSRTENRPERTVYQLTDSGRQTIHSWLREMLARPASEYPEFPAALSFIYLLEPDAARDVLTRRTVALEADQERLSLLLAEHADTVPRLFLLELEYLKMAADAQLTWVRAVSGDLAAGRLTWSREWIRSVTHSEATASLKPGVTE